MLDFQLYRRSAKTRNDHFARMGQAGWTSAHIRSVLSAATTCMTTSELLASVEMSEREQARIEKRGERAFARIDAVAQLYGGRAEFSGDPRGCPSIVGCSLPRTAWASDGYALD